MKVKIEDRVMQVQGKMNIHVHRVSGIECEGRKVLVRGVPVGCEALVLDQSGRLEMRHVVALVQKGVAA